IISGATKVAAGDATTCAIVANGVVKCWGANNAGQLGNGNQNDSVIAAVNVILPMQATEIAARGNQFYARTADNNVYGWGDGCNNRLGDGGGCRAVSTPVLLPSTASSMQIVAGFEGSCVVKSDKTMSCWSANDHGQAGTGNFDGAATPTKVLDVSDIVQAAAG